MWQLNWLFYLLIDMWYDVCIGCICRMSQKRRSCVAYSHTLIILLSSKIRILSMVLLLLKGTKSQALCVTSLLECLLFLIQKDCPKKRLIFSLVMSWCSLYSAINSKQTTLIYRTIWGWIKGLLESTMSTWVASLNATIICGMPRFPSLFNFLS